MTFAELDHLLAIEDPTERALEGQRLHGKTWMSQAEVAMTPGIRSLCICIANLQRRIDELEAL